jgi:hypothetical protein
MAMACKVKLSKLVKNIHISLTNTVQVYTGRGKQTFGTSNKHTFNISLYMDAGATQI